SRSIVLMEFMRHAGSGERRAVVFHVLWRGVGVVVTVKADHRTGNVLGERQRRLIAGTKRLLDIATVEGCQRRKLPEMTGSQPGHPPSPAMSHDREPLRIDA